MTHNKCTVRHNAAVLYYSIIHTVIYRVHEVVVVVRTIHVLGTYRYVIYTRGSCRAGRYTVSNKYLTNVIIDIGIVAVIFVMFRRFCITH